MSEVRLSIITPTCGRETLWAALESARGQLGIYDEHIIVMDGHMPEVAKRLENPFTKSWRWRALPMEQGGRYGNPARDFGLSYAMGTHIVYLDDDDELADGALKAIRHAVSLAPERPHMFRIEQKSTRIIHGDNHSLAPFTCCGSQLVAPNIKPPPKWDAQEGDAYTREVDVIKQVVARLGEPLWHPHLTHNVGPAGVGQRP